MPTDPISRALDLADKMFNTILMVEDGELLAIEVPLRSPEYHKLFVAACGLFNLKVEILDANTDRERVRVSRN